LLKNWCAKSSAAIVTLFNKQHSKPPQGASDVLRLICLVIFSATFVGASPDDPFRQTLTSVSRNIHLDTWQVTHRDFDFKSATPWSVQKYTLRGGRQEGVDRIVLNNGPL